MNLNTGTSAGQIIGTMNGQQVIGLDIAKHVFQMHTVDMGTGEIINVQIKRAKVLEHFANKQPCLIAIEACGGAHHWAITCSVRCSTLQRIPSWCIFPIVGPPQHCRT